ncbi:hypothetical protein, partial [Gluconobacter oxydans]|uniref:hypothetical protein n=1 Tax=Gluconobacter oxydans TaxID=442 RepID=UPI00209E8C38
FFQCQPPSKLAPHESRNLRHGNPKNHASAKVVLETCMIISNFSALFLRLPDAADASGRGEGFS